MGGRQQTRRPSLSWQTPRFGRRVAEISRRFLALEPHEVELRIREGLALAGEIAGADRGYLIVVRPGGSRRVAVHEWCAPGVDSLPQPTKPEDLRPLSWASKRLAQGEIIQGRPGLDFPADASAERNEAQRRGVRAVLAIPLRSRERVLGVLTFECLKHTRRWAEDEVALLHLVGEIFAGAVHRRHSQEALRASDARFRALAEHATELVAELDARGRYLYASPSFESLLGHPPHDLLGTPSESLIHPDDLAASRTSFAAALERQGVARAVHRLRHADGSWRWFENSGRAYRTERGGLRFVSIGRDITERRAMEEALRQSQMQLLQTQKMEALGRLAGGVAHDFNNLLTVILGNSDLLLEDSSGAHAQEEMLAIREAAERAASLTERLLAFSSSPSPERTRLDVNHVVRGVEEMLRRLLGEEIQLEISCTDRTTAVEADSAQLEQVLVNLAVNARDAMSGRGRLSISTALRDVGSAQAPRLGLSAPGRYVELCVTDAGQGMDEATAARAFEPFFTTKEPGKGTGLGLSIVYGVARRAGGAASLRSRPGGGTTVRVLLPLAAAHVRTAPPEPSAGTARGDETVLAVEDEASVRKLLRRSLEQAGYRVLEADSGERALEVAKRHAGPIHLLVTDVVMPGMRGGELALRLRRVRPELRTLFISGYPDDAGSALTTPAKRAFLQKPFTPASLLCRVRALLNEAPAADG